jgi:hypothetical protein
VLNAQGQGGVAFLPFGDGTLIAGVPDCPAPVRRRYVEPTHDRHVESLGRGQLGERGIPADFQHRGIRAGEPRIADLVELAEVLVNVFKVNVEPVGNEVDGQCRDSSRKIELINASRQKLWHDKLIYSHLMIFMLE